MIPLSMQFLLVFVYGYGTAFCAEILKKRWEENPLNCFGSDSVDARCVSFLWPLLLPVFALAKIAEWSRERIVENRRLKEENAVLKSHVDRLTNGLIEEEKT